MCSNLRFNYASFFIPVLQTFRSMRCASFNALDCAPVCVPIFVFHALQFTQVFHALHRAPVFDSICASCAPVYASYLRSSLCYNLCQIFLAHPVMTKVPFLFVKRMRLRSNTLACIQLCSVHYIQERSLICY